MFIRTQPASRLCVIAFVLAAAVPPVAAQYGKPPAEVAKGASATLTTTLVRTGLYMISGGGGNSLLRLSANGLIVVDGKLPGNYEALQKQIHRVSDQPVRVLILTDPGTSHVGNNQKFLDAGTQIIAQENAKQYLAARDGSGAAVGPSITYDREYTLRLGGVDAQLLHFGSARTGADTVVYFPNLKVVAVGDLFASTPNPDFAAGGSLVGWGPVLGQILKLDFDVVAPGTGSTVGRADLEALKIKIDTLVSRASGLVAKGVPKDQLMAELKTDDLGWQFNFTGEALDHFYAELSRTK